MAPIWGLAGVSPCELRSCQLPGTYFGSGRGKQIATQLGLPEPDHVKARNWFQHRVLGLVLEAYRREEISRGKLTEVAAMIGVDRDHIDKLIRDVCLGDDAPTTGSEP